ncbi:hypothetical protein AGMMS50268_22330 [Spirochaetia bacterium]|nr:hypothetical protein AGMMS50268_22330 [Spirochaetia bacterium]
MKNGKMILGGMAVLLLAFGLVFTACATTGGGTGGNTDPKTITINGISALTGDVRILIFSDLNNIHGTSHQPVNVAVANGTLTSSFITVDLFVPTNNFAQSTTKWKGSGSYYIYIVGKNNDRWSTNNAYIYAGSGDIPLQYNINEAAITLSFDNFKKYNTWKN